MSKTVLMLFAACVGLSLLSLHLVKQMHAGQATIAELQAQVATLERQQQQRAAAPSAQPSEPASFSTFQSEPPSSTPPPPPAKEVAKTAAVKASAAAPEGIFAAPSREERMRMAREHRERQRQLMQDPDYREALRLQHRGNMARQYPGLAQELGLTAEQTDQLFNLLADQQMRSSEQMEPMWDMETVDPTTLQQRREKMQQQWTEMQRKNEAELAAHLGQDKLQAWKEYQSTLGARHQAEQLRNTLANQGVPLGEDASRAVVKALAEAQKVEMQEHAAQARVAGAVQGTPAIAFQSGGAAPEVYERQLEMAKKRNQRVLDALSPYLTYEQREAVEREHEAQIKMQEAQIRIMRAQAKSGANNEAGIVTNSVQGFFVPQ